MKKVLIVTYNWPPAGGIAVLRCLKFVKYLRQSGWEPIVFTVKNPSYQFLDPILEKEIPAGIEIHKVSFFEPTSLFKLISGRKKNQPLQNITSNSSKKKGVIDHFGMWVRGNFFIPDARSKWIKPAVKYLDDYLKNNSIDAILSDGPPHTNTVIALKIAEKHTIPWLADFQDPWTQVDYFEHLHIGDRARKKHHFLEQKTFKIAKKITIASDSWKTDLEQIGAENVDVVYYGFDESEFKNFEHQISDKIIIFHGGLLGEDRNPISLIKAIHSILEKNPGLSSKIDIRLAGEIDLSVKATIAQFNLSGIVTYLGMISRSEVIKEYQKAALLLLPINKAKNANGRIPGKLFEMLRTNKPILVFGPTDGDVKRIVENKKKGTSFEYDQITELHDALLSFFNSGVFENFDQSTSVTEFTNESITQKIATYLDEISA